MAKGDSVSRSLARKILTGTAIVACSVTGCAGTYDIVTSQRFKERPFHTLFTREDPIQVLETVEDGNDRVRAMKNLKEPREHGGTAAQQDRIIAILEASATTDSRPLCRIAAIETLTRFKDPRVGPILLTAYKNSAHDDPTKSNGVEPAGVSGLALRGAISQFGPETVTKIQCQTLKGLGERRNPEGLQLLIQVASAPVDRPKTSNGIEPAAALSGAGGVPLASAPDPHAVRLAAIRSLEHYERDPAATRALIAILQVEKDVAVRGRTHESLKKVTGQDLPPDGQAWANWLEKAPKTR